MAGERIPPGLIGCFSRGETVVRFKLKHAYQWEPRYGDEWHYEVTATEGGDGELPAILVKRSDTGKIKRILLRQILEMKADEGRPATPPRGTIPTTEGLEK
tara:strand:+ start:822 stop:1124 length:303 start_codon:yes stop_codon:yes gene_type:complete